MVPLHQPRQRIHHHVHQQQSSKRIDIISKIFLTEICKIIVPYFKYRADKPDKNQMVNRFRDKKSQLKVNKNNVFSIITYLGALVT